MKDQCFYHLDHFPLFTKFYLDEAKRAYYPPWELHKYASRIECSKDNSFDRSSLLRQLKKQFPGTTASYHRFQPGTMYKFHTDQADDAGQRKLCSINVVLSEQMGLTLFHMDWKNSATRQIIACDYVRFRPTLFNAQIPHCVINASTDTRYLMMVSFYAADFATVRTYLDSIKVEHY